MPDPQMHAASAMPHPKDPVGKYEEVKHGELMVSERPIKDNLRILAVSDSPWAPTGFGTNTKNVACILYDEGHLVGYGGCQNPQHGRWGTPWPLDQKKDRAYFELLPIMYPGQEKWGEKSFPSWIGGFKPELVLGHLDFQMFKHMTEHKKPTFMRLPLYGPDGNLLSETQRVDIVNKAFKDVGEGAPWKLAVVIPYDGEPSIKEWQDQVDVIDYGIAMSKYGQIGLKKDFGIDCTYIPHGVDTGLFKPIMEPKYGGEPKPDAFILGCVARNQHRKNIPRLIKGFAQFVKKNKLSSKEAKLILHMDWKDFMGWNITEMTDHYGITEYLMKPLMGQLDAGEAITEEDMAHMYNCMDVFVLPTGGEGFGIPTLEAMSCGVPICVTNYTTSYELIKCEDPENEDIPMYPVGGHHTDCMPNGRDHLIDEDICERGILLPYKDMWWDVPKRAAPQRAICSENAICEALELYYKDPQKKLATGKAARKHAIKEYSWEVVGKRWRDLSKKITKEIRAEPKRKGNWLDISVDVPADGKTDLEHKKDISKEKRMKRRTKK